LINNIERIGSMGCKTATNVVTKIKIPKIPKYQVVMLNDDITTMEFVVRILIEIFEKSEDEANSLMMKIHLTGDAVVGVYSKEIAETKSSQAMERARAEEFPLVCEVREK